MCILISAAKAEALWEKAGSRAEEALQLDSASVKARFRLATALERLGKAEDALVHAKAGQLTAPDDLDLKRLGEKLVQKLEKQKQQQKKVFQKMFA